MLTYCIPSYQWSVDWSIDFIAMSFISSKSLYHTWKRFYFSHRYSIVQFRFAVARMANISELDILHNELISWMISSSLFSPNVIFRTIAIESQFRMYFVLGWTSKHDNQTLQKKHVDVFIFGHQTLVHSPQIIIKTVMMRFRSLDSW